MSPDDPQPVRRAAKVFGGLVALRAIIRAARSRKPEPPRRCPSLSSTRASGPCRPAGEPRRSSVLLLLVAAVFGFAFTVLYIVLSGDTQLLGIAMGGALLPAGDGVPSSPASSSCPRRRTSRSAGALLDEEKTEEVVGMIEKGGEGISRRVLLTGAGGAGRCRSRHRRCHSPGLAWADAGPLHYTPWARGVRLVDDEARPYKASDIQIGTFYTALPEHRDPESFGSGLLVVRLPAELIHLPEARRDWAPNGILAYSKICPHAGCAISLYRYPTYAPTSQMPAFTCPCHYSTFLPGEGGRLVFGPAGRALPQLPLMIDGDGYLRAAAGFHEDIGPSWWGVHRDQS